MSPCLKLMVSLTVKHIAHILLTNATHPFPMCTFVGWFCVVFVPIKTNRYVPCHIHVEYILVGPVYVNSADKLQTVRRVNPFQGHGLLLHL